MDWSTYIKTKPMEATKIEGYVDVRHIGNPKVVHREGEGVAMVETSEGVVRAEYPFYLVRDPEEPKHVWPVRPDKFEAWYEPQPEE